jgi:hypothetical protein
MMEYHESFVSNSSPCLFLVVSSETVVVSSLLSRQSSPFFSFLLAHFSLGTVLLIDAIDRRTVRTE